MNRLIVFLLFFVMLGTTPTWADSTILERQLTLNQIRVEVTPLLQVDILLRQQPLTKVAHLLTPQQQTLQTLTLVIAEL